MTQMDKLPLVYVAGPYSAPDPVANTREAILTAEALMDSGLLCAFIPHLSLTHHLVAPHDLEWWYDYDLAILSRCDAVFRIQGESNGADREILYADDTGIPVFVDRETLLTWARDWVDPLDG